MFCNNKIKQIIKKYLSFLRHPYLPYLLEKPLKTNSPRLYRLLKYRTINVTSKKYWNGVWAEEGLSTWRTYPNLYKSIKNHIRPGSIVLDVGSGPGILLNNLKSEFNCDCIGLDISLIAMKLLKKNNISGVVSCLPTLPFKDRSFDYVVATQVLEHLQDPLEALKQFKRVTKLNGKIICSVPNAYMTKEKCDEHLHNFSEQTFTSLFKGLSDFKIMNLNDLGGPKLLAIMNIT